MIVELSIKNFGSIKTRQTLSMIASKDATLESYYIHQTAGLRLMKMAILYGSNASGKTTVLNALDFMRELVVGKKKSDKSDTLDFLPFQFDASEKQGTSEIYIDFIEKNQRFQYKVEFTQTYIVSEQLDFYTSKSSKALLFSRTTDEQKQLSKIQFGEKAKVKSRDLIKIEGNTIWNITVLRAFSMSNVDIPLLKEVSDWFKNTLMPIVRPTTKLTIWAGKRLAENPALKKTVQELVNHADIQISDFEIKQEETEMEAEFKSFLQKNTQNSDEVIENEPVKTNSMDIIFQHKITNAEDKVVHFELTDKQQSHGTMRFWGLSTLLSVLIHDSNVVSIDELETSLHPELMKYFILIALVNTKNAQIFFTTHNLNLLSERDILRNDAIWFTEKQKDGSTELYSAAHFESGVLRTDGSILNAYKQGRLGARPDPGSIFLSSKPISLN
jgi:AAA15 family ATPase/GTPase